MNKLCVIGLGYIGLPTAVMFASHGLDVIGVDINKEVVDGLNNGALHVDEPNIYETFKQALDSGKLRIKTSPEAADAFIIAVPTPFTPTKMCDLSYVISAAESIVPHLKKGDLVILESTVAPKTTEDVVMPILAKSGFEVGEEIYLAHCPERVLPGKIMYELTHNNRIIGGINEISTRKAAELYSVFVEGELLYTDATTAEMSKLMENTFRDVNIALANELAKICDKIGINTWEVIKLANKHPRVNIHSPGPGVGGHCLAVDPYFIIEKAPEETKLISMAREINNNMPEYVVSKVDELLYYNVAAPKIAVLGITYKGNTNDLRESPAVEIVDMLINKGYDVMVNDPHASCKRFAMAGLEDAVKDADCMLILADHDEFKHMDIANITSTMKQKIIFDTKNCIENSEGFDGLLYKIGDGRCALTRV
jgi:UDP-N-acetyl-D-mannosaminuronic acid dehydrogenase